MMRIQTWVVLAATFVLLSHATVMIACDPGATVTYVNDTNGPIFVDVNNGGEIRVEPHSKSRQSDLGRDQDAYAVTVTDERGNVLYHEETTFGEIKKRKQPIVIEGLVPSPTPP
jgi:hypothetical protein